MFKNLHESIKALNVDVSNVANSEKAKKLRKTLIRIGLPMAIVGFLGMNICLILFATAGFSAFGPNGFTARILVPFILFLPCGALGAIGASLTSLGFSIVVTGYTTNLINETVGHTCKGCGATITPDTNYCPKCGQKAQQKCPNCKQLNSNKNEYCEKCGTKLN